MTDISKDVFDLEEQTSTQALDYQLAANAARLEMVFAVAAEPGKTPSLTHAQGRLRALREVHESANEDHAASRRDTRMRIADIAANQGDIDAACFQWEEMLRTAPMDLTLRGFALSAANRHPVLSTALRTLNSRYGFDSVGVRDSGLEFPFSVHAETGGRTFLVVSHRHGAIRRYDAEGQAIDEFSNGLNGPADVCPLEDGSFWVAERDGFSLALLRDDGHIVDRLFVNRLLPDAPHQPLRIVRSGERMIVLLWGLDMGRRLACFSITGGEPLWVVDLADDLTAVLGHAGERVFLGGKVRRALFEVDPQTGAVSEFAVLPGHEETWGVTARPVFCRSCANQSVDASLDADILVTSSGALHQFDARGRHLSSVNLTAVENRPWLVRGLDVVKGPQSGTYRLALADARSGGLALFDLA